jgi:hypothetical protein
VKAKQQDYEATRALDRRALELLRGGTGHTLLSAYQAAREMRKSKGEK